MNINSLTDVQLTAIGHLFNCLKADTDSTTAKNIDTAVMALRVQADKLRGMGTPAGTGKFASTVDEIQALDNMFTSGV